MAIESIGGSLVSKISELLVEPVKKQFRYMFCFNNFVEEFNEQVRSLVLALYDLQVAVNDATNNVEEIEIYVNTWLEDAKKALALYGLQDAVNVATKNAKEIEIDVNKWLEDAKNEMEGLENEKGKNGKCYTWCPKWICQFKLSKALEKKTKTLRKLEEKSKKFQKVSHKAPLQDIEFLPSKEFTSSESSKEAFEHIMKALIDDNVNMIGLYGMGGVGKTTLVKEVGRRAKETQLFDEVLFATMSQNPNVIDIQDRIADRLRLQFDVKTKEGRANLLWQRLKTKKKVLVLLDDVWKVVDLKEIGIPFGEAHRGCKVLLTTRLKDICSYMECQPIVFLSILSENEAWALFKINARLREEDLILNTLAKKVARECQGLPIALMTVGRALRDKSTVEWEVASKQLKNSQFQHMELIGEQKNTYACLKLSYDYLKHKETKLCFLLCCLFPEDYNIPIEDLTRYAVGYEIHQDVESIEDARKQVYVAIKILKDCCMLLGTKTEEYVKMHKLVRDVAIQIASSKEHGFMVKAGIGLKEWPMSTKSFEGCTTISLMGNELAELPERLACPQLKVLLLELDDDLNVPERFFEGIKEIEVLSLKGGCLSLQSLEFSTNLQSLLLVKCKCNDLIWLRKLQRLKILGFIWLSYLEELPDEIRGLKELRLLDVTGCSSLGRIPVNWIGRLKKLEELLIGGDSFKGWDAVGCDSIERTNAGLTELNSLSHLAVLSLKIPRVECIPRDFVFPRLLKYDIVLGNGYSATEYPTSTRLYLHDISATSLNTKTFEHLFCTVSQIGFINVKGLENIALSCDQMTSHGHGSQKDFLQKLEDVKVKGCRDTRTLFPAKWQQAFNNLTSVEIEDCKSLEEVFELGEGDEGSSEMKELRLLSSLTTLVLRRLLELKCIWKGPTRHVSLRSLIHLELLSLDKLTFIFTPSLAQSLANLKTLQIKRCSGLKHLIGEKDDEREIIPESFGFPKLKTLSISGCDELKYVFPVSVSPSLLNLEEMNIEDCKSLEEVFELGEAGEGINKEKDLLRLLSSLTRLELIWLPELKCIWKGPTRHVSLQSLIHLELLSLDKLTFIFTPSLAQSLVNLETLQIKRCNGLKHLIGEKDDEREIIPDSFGFPKLKTLSISGCDELEYVFPVSVSPSLLNLEKMNIEYCKSLEEVFELGEAGEGINKEKELLWLLSSLARLELKWLPELKCIWKGSTRHVSLRSLIHLELWSLYKLTFIFTPSLTQSLVHLQTLWIDDCSGLKHLIREMDDERELIPESVSFPKLKALFISGCDELEYVFPVSVSPSLQNLDEMKIAYGVNLKKIFYSGEGDALTKDGIINFPQLKKLSLSRCDFFGPKNFTARLPSLQVLAIDGHEELGDLLAQLQEHANLRKIHITACKGAQEIMQARRTGHEHSFLSLEKLDLRSLPDTRCLWKGLVLSHLTTLKVYYCHKLTHVFTSNMVASLVQLQFLKILACWELEQIIAKDNDDEKDQILSGSDLQSFCFPNLCQVEITGCNKLRSLFPVAMAAGLPKLQKLEVRDSSQLLGVFGQDDHASPVNVEKQMVLPNLSFLMLYNLPSIVYFSLGCDDFLFPRLEMSRVHKCPKLTTQFDANQHKINAEQYQEAEQDWEDAIGAEHMPNMDIIVT